MTLAALLISLFVAADDRPLALDPSFGAGGVATVKLGPGDVDVGHLRAVRGELHAITRAGSDRETAVAQHRVDTAAPVDIGEPPPPYDGRCTTSVAVRSDGNLVVMSSFGSQMFLHAASQPRVSRLPAAPSFGTDGRIAPATPLYIRAVALDRHDRIYLARYTGGPVLERYTADGRPDASFGPGGVRAIDAGRGCVRPLGLAADTRGRVLVAIADCPSSDVIALVALDDDGRLDAAWGDAGIARLPSVRHLVSPGSVELLALRDGRVLVAYATAEGARLHAVGATGVVDSSFGDGGLVIHRDPAMSSGYLRLAAGATGRIALGYATQQDGRVVLLESDGDVDTAAGRGGIIDAPGARSTCGGLANFAPLAVEDDGGIAYSRVPADSWRATAVVRLDPFGRPRAEFGTGGEVRFRGGAVPAHAYRVFVDAASDAVAVAMSQGRVVLAGITSSGELDTRFGDAGIARLAYPVHGRPPAATLDAAGRLLLHFPIAGDPFALSALESGVHRFLRDGRADPSFGYIGRALPPAAYPVPFFFALHADARSRVVLLGVESGNYQAVRFDAGGTLDWGYGRAAVAGLGLHVAATSVAPDGTLAVLRTDSLGVPQRLDRYDADGAYVSGVAIAPGAAPAAPGPARVLVSFDDGSFTLCSTDRVGSRLRHVARRFSANGQLDPAYGEGGVAGAEALLITWRIVVDRERTCRFIETLPDMMRLSAVRADGTVEASYVGPSIEPDDLVLDARRRLCLAGSRNGRIALARTAPLP